MIFQKNYWHQIINTPAWNNWAGYSFENICLKHVHQIIKSLQLDNIVCLPSSWRFTPPKGSTNHGAQIDLLLDRTDNAVTICEIKYSRNPYRLDKQEAKNILNKADAFQNKTKSKKQMFIALISNQEIKPSLWLDDVADAVVTLEDLFT